MVPKSAQARYLEVRMDVTDRCNLRCPHCVRHGREPGSGHEMTSPTLARIASEVFPRAHTVHLACAGEPLMSPLFEEAVMAATRARVPRVCLVTNGALLNERRARFCLDQGIAEVTFSLESSQPERFARSRLGTTLEAVLANVDRLRALRDAAALLRPRIHFNVIVMRGNLDELDEIADLCREHGGEKIRFGFLVVDNEEMRSEAPVRSPAETNAAMERLQAHVASWPQGVEIPARLGDGGKFARCPQAWTGLFISVDGDVWPCFRLQGEPFGSLARQGLEEILRSEAWRTLHREHALARLRPVCAVCVETGNHDSEAAYENALRIPVPPGSSLPLPEATGGDARLESLVRALEDGYRGDRRRSDAHLAEVLGGAWERDSGARVAAIRSLSSADAAWIVGRLMEHRGDGDAAVAAYRRFLELAEARDPRIAAVGPWLDQVEVEHALAAAVRAVALADPPSALRHLRHAAAIDPGVSLPADSLEAALAACDAALVGRVRSPGTLLGIADLALTAWSPGAAVAAFARYLELAPEGPRHAVVRKALEALPPPPVPGPPPRRSLLRSGVARLRRLLPAGLGPSPSIVASVTPGPDTATEPPQWDAPRGLVLRMDVNNRCNLSCVACGLARSRAASGEAPSDMPLDLFRRIVAEVLPHCATAALSCEAEPTLHPQIVAIVRAAAEATGTELFLTTNGMAMTDALLEALVDAPLAGLNVSIDGASEESFARIRKNGSLSRVAHGLDRFAAVRARRSAADPLARPRLQINVTLMRSNLHELPDIARLAGGWGAARLTLQHVYALEDNGLHAESLALEPERSDAVLRETEELCRSFGIETTFPDPFGQPRPSGGPSPPEVQVAGGAASSCRAPWSMLKIWWDGRVFPCDLWGRGREGLGDLRRQSFREIWESPAYAALRRGLSGEGRLHDACAGCSMVTTDNLERLERRSPLAFTAAQPAPAPFRGARVP